MAASGVILDHFRHRIDPVVECTGLRCWFKLNAPVVVPAPVLAFALEGTDLVVALGLLVVVAGAAAFLIYDRRPKKPAAPTRPATSLDPDLPAKARPYVPPTLRPGGSADTTPPPLMPPTTSTPRPPLPAPFGFGDTSGQSTPDDLGLDLPPPRGN